MKIAIASGKGGTGKTTLATNLAFYMAESESVVLADLDVEEPNSGLFVQGRLHHRETTYKMIPVWNKDLCTHGGNCQTVCNFNAVLAMPRSVMVFPELCHGCFACSELCPTGSLPMTTKPMGELKHLKTGALDFIEGKLMIGEEQAVPLIKQTLAYIKRGFPENIVKILDAPPGTSCPVIEVTKDADLVILVTEPTPFGFHDLKLAVDTVRHLEKRFTVVLNRFGIGDDKVTRYCEEEGIDLIARIPNSRKIAEIYSAGGLLYQEVTEVRDAVKSVVAYIHNHSIGQES
ncbi:MAG: ATP-binding protein [Candidatus Eisenbacteria bacterium]|uniref:ATP-binding protein n=1 Tax=Eiseniibacteriota bacterium TaxID=2212470 RepID=A0A948RXT8_UNCEI|nr:ATP-binding protein [Candidatus Eisenbacteria bacterium]MBU1949745.1 ATP-binding protein [Candidatus Eisenbacteria bacterium]MBU2691574.1 ATP-binding protein [Candidatus Eisenbacteria bacterium]